MASLALKKGAASLGLDESRISSHYLKIGGPSDMHATCFGDDAIRRKSKQASDASLGYQMSSKRDVGPLITASQGLGLTVEDVRVYYLLNEKGGRPTVSGDTKMILKVEWPKSQSAGIPDVNLKPGGGLPSSSSGKGILNYFEYELVGWVYQPTGVWILC